MALQNFFATKTGSSALGSSDNEITLITPPSVAPGRLVLEPKSVTNREVVYYTAILGNKVTGVTRGRGGTTAKPHAASVSVQMNVLAEDIEDLRTSFESMTATDFDGWVNTSVAPIVTVSKGQREYTLRYPGVDYTNKLQPGTKWKGTRTVAPGTQSADFEASSSQFASNTSSTGITFTDDFTIESWVKLESYPASSGMIVNRTDSTFSNGWTLRVNSIGTLTIVGLNAGASRTVTSYQSLPLGRWVHVAASLDMSAGTGAVYIDGIAVSSVIAGAATGLVQSGDLMIGARATPTDYFDGQISDARLWSTIRTATEIRTNKDQAIVGNETGLIGYWKLNGDFNDSTANANTLTPSGGAIATFAEHPHKATEYAIITNVSYAAPDTTLTVFTGNNHNLPVSGGIGASSYSDRRAPFGFPADASRWKVAAYFVMDRTFSVPSAANWYNCFPGLSLIVPTGGGWHLKVSSCVTYMGSTAGTIVGRANITTDTLAVDTGTTSTGNFLKDTVGRYGGIPSTTEINFDFYKETRVSTDVPTAYLAVFRMEAGAGSFSIRHIGTAMGAMSYIEAECAYL